MSKDKREAEHPVELETQFIMRLPEEPARELKNLLQSGDGLKNRLTIEFDQDMRKGEVKFDNRTMHGKIVDLPTVVESMKTIDKKSLYKTADICQMMICKEEPDQTTEDEMPSKNKKKDPYKVDKKFLYPHGITPPTKNVRKRRFRKTLRKKCAESPEIEKEVKRLLRADSEAESFTYEIINEEDEHLLYPKPDPIPQPSTSKKEKKGKGGRGSKRSKTASSVNIDTPSTSKNTASSNVVDIFGGAVSDSDLEDERNIQTHNQNTDGFPIHLAKADPMIGFGGMTQTESLDFDSQVFALSNEMQSKMFASEKNYDLPGTSDGKVYGLPFEDEGDQSRDSRDSMTVRIDLVKSELDELKERKKQMQLEIAGMENPTLRQRFQDTLHKLNQDVMYKEMEYQGLLTLQNSEII